MEKDDRQNGSPEQQVEGSREPQRTRPAPGKVTRTSKLPRAVERQFSAR